MHGCDTFAEHETRDGCTAATASAGLPVSPARTRFAGQAGHRVSQPKSVCSHTRLLLASAFLFRWPLARQLNRLLAREVDSEPVTRHCKRPQGTQARLEDSDRLGMRSKRFGTA